MYRERLDLAIHEFYKLIDTIEIAKQLSRKAAAEFLTPLAVEFELQKRATIAGMLFRPFQDDNARVKFVQTLARLCLKQETRRLKVFKRKQVALVACKADTLSFSNTRQKDADGSEKSLVNKDCEIVKEDFNTP